MSGNEVIIRVRTDDQTRRPIERLNRQFNGLRQSMSRVGTTMAGVFGTQVVNRLMGGFSEKIQDTITQASDLNESYNAVQKVFGSSSNEILKWGEANAEAIGLSKKAFNQATVPLGAMLRNQGLALSDVTGRTIELTERAADMASVFNTSVADALMAINAGLRGEQDPLERYGVTVSALRVQELALATTHKKSAKELTNVEKATARLNLIMDQTKSTAGDFRATSDQLANSSRVGAAHMENLRAEIGTKLIPAKMALMKATSRLTEVVASRLIPALNKISEWAKTNQELLKKVAHVIGEVLVVAFTAWAYSATKAAMASLAANWQLLLIVGTILAVGKALAYAYHHWDSFREVVDKVAHFVSSRLGPALKQLARIVEDQVVKAAELAVRAWPTLVSVLKTVAGFLMGTVVPALSEVAHWLRSKLPDAIKITVSGVRMLRHVFSSIAGFISDKVVPVVVWLAKALAVQTVEAAKLAVRAWHSMVSVLKTVARFLMGTVVPALSDVAHWLRNKLPDAIKITVSGAKMLSKVLGSVAGFISGEVVPVVVRLAKAVAEQAVIAWRLLVRVLGTVAGFLAGTVVPTIADLIQWLSHKLPEAIGVAASGAKLLGRVLVGVAGFIADEVIPVVGLLAKDILEILTPIIQIIVARLRVLWHVLRVLAEFIFTKVVPALITIAKVIAKLLKPVIIVVIGLLWVLWKAFRALVELISATVVPVVVWLIKTLDKILVSAVRVCIAVLSTLWEVLRAIAGFISGKVVPIVVWLAKAIAKQLQPAVDVMIIYIWAWWKVLRAIAGFISDKVVPVVVWLAKVIAKVLMPIISFGVAYFKAWWHILRAIAGFISDNVVPVVVWLAKAIAKQLQPVIDVMIIYIWAWWKVLRAITGFIADKVVPVVVWLAKAIAKQLTPVIRLGVAYLKIWLHVLGVIAGFISDNVVPVIATMASGLKDGLGAAIEWVVKGLKWMVQAFTTHLGQMFDTLSVAFSWVPKLDGKLEAARKALHKFAMGAKDEMLGIQDTTISVTAESKGGGRHDKAMASGGIARAASGGLRSRLTLLGEHGPELAALSPGTHVYSHGDSERMIKGMGQSGGTVRVVLDLQGGDKAFLDFIRKLIRDEGGGDVQIALGR